nr:leucine--tRNA ligase [Anaerolineaceae bacterium]
STEKEKSGIFTGGYAINPVNGEKIPVWISDYVLMTYGTCAIMAVPAHDERDFDFARKFHLPLRIVIQPPGLPELKSEDVTMPLPAFGTMVNSGELSGTPAEQSFRRAVAYVEKIGAGKAATNYRLRDWLISRQRYWGAPIPVVHCPDCGAVTVPEDQLPVQLPDDVEWKPTGESPLKLHPTWRFTTCPQCGKPAERETDTMDTFVCSSWYHLRYLSPDYDKGPFDPQEYDYWMPVDIYTGGIEHANMHLIYTRFFHKALRDMGLTKGNEPMLQLRNQGMVLGEDSEKMSKSRGNVVSPDDLVHTYGADATRAYLMFFARWDMGGPWSSGGIDGVMRWLRRAWSLVLEPGQTGAVNEESVKTLRRKVHQTLRSVSRDFEQFEFNTIISSLMELSNEMAHLKDSVYGSDAWKEAIEIYLQMMAPVVPHIAEELWQRIHKPYSVHTSRWPSVDEKAAADEEITLVVQLNGKVRDRITVPVDISEEEAKTRALKSDIIQKQMEGKEARQIIYVKGRLINIVV